LDNAEVPGLIGERILVGFGLELEIKESYDFAFELSLSQSLLRLLELTSVDFVLLFALVAFLLLPYLVVCQVPH